MTCAQFWLSFGHYSPKTSLLVWIWASNSSIVTSIFYTIIADTCEREHAVPLHPQYSCHYMHSAEVYYSIGSNIPHDFTCCKFFWLSSSVWYVKFGYEFPSMAGPHFHFTLRLLWFEYQSSQFTTPAFRSRMGGWELSTGGTHCVKTKKMSVWIFFNTLEIVTDASIKTVFPRSHLFDKNIY